jgi:hypothetical protein
MKKAEPTLRTDGPTLEDYVLAGYGADTYPPEGYAEVASPGLEAYRAEQAKLHPSGAAPAPTAPWAETHPAPPVPLYPKTLAVPGGGAVVVHTLEHEHQVLDALNKAPARWESDSQIAEKYQHPTAHSGLDLPVEIRPYPKMLHGEPPKDKDGKPTGAPAPTVTVQTAEDEAALDAGRWKASPAEWLPKKDAPAPPVRTGKAAAVVAMLLAALALFTAPVFAQTAPTTTTLSAQLNAPQPGAPATTVSLASCTNIVAPSATQTGTELFFDQEAAIVQAVQSTTPCLLSVLRGYDASPTGTPNTGAFHPNGSLVYAGPVTGAFGTPFTISDPPLGGCTLASEVYTVRINTRNGRIWTCGSNSRWQLQTVAPLINASPAATVTLTAAQSGQAFAFDRAAGVIYTLPTPAVGLNYRFIFTVAQTSAANEVQTAPTTSVTLFMQGVITVTGTTTMGFAGVPTTSVAIKTNDTTTGGLIGGDFTCTGISGTLWSCNGTVVGSGTVATPFVTAN